MKIDWISKLQHALETVGFSLGIATILWGLFPNAAYGPNVVYSLSIGLLTWAIIDLGRHLFPAARETGWPHGIGGYVLIPLGVIGGLVGGTLITGYIGRTLDWFEAPNLFRFQDMRVAIIITLLAAGGGTFFFYTRSKSAFLEQKIAETQQHADEARLKLLETQLEPHMLFNTLANLRVLIGVDAARAQVMLDHMIAYLRATLAASRATSHPMQAEFDRLRDYLELMAIRMGPRLRYTLDLPADLAQQPVPTLLLQPLVENCIQHGLEPKVGGGEVQVKAHRDGGTVVVEVRDTGVGPGDAPPASGKGFGMTQVRERLATLFGPRASIAFGAAEEGGARTVIRYPATA